MAEFETSKAVITRYLTLRGFQRIECNSVQIKNFYCYNLYFINPSADEKTLVLWTDKIGKEELRSLISSSVWNDFLFVLIYIDKVTNECLKDIIILNDNKRKIEVFSISELQYDIFSNVMNPTVEVLDEEEKKVLLKSYKSLPKVLLSDPVCRYRGCQKGDILKYSRSGNVPYYRIVSS